MIYHAIVYLSYLFRLVLCNVILIFAGTSFCLNSSDCMPFILSRDAFSLKRDITYKNVLYDLSI